MSDYRTLSEAHAAFNSRECPACHGEGLHEGDLGRLRWYRCRACGMEFSVPISLDTESGMDSIPMEDDD